MDRQMNRHDIVRGVLDITASDGMNDCRQLHQRFRKALMTANPDLTDDMMGAYDRAFEDEYPALAATGREARVEAAAKLLSEDQIALWRSVLELPGIGMFFASLRALGPDFLKATQGVFQKEGIGAHARSSERLFESLEQAAETAGP